MGFGWAVDGWMEEVGSGIVLVGFLWVEKCDL